ncbi:hypothetical protein FOZ61_006736 [Perkinsus olseni]|uniref:DNA-directed RNA polymerase n=1 Tax=Perkinsus olseni TaxID=32597 RepID=A0A7J6LC56_PEROL|nr:hypothetical protein FOZ61_006736 [Perkinsus olseni]
MRAHKPRVPDILSAALDDLLDCRDQFAAMQELKSGRALPVLDSPGPADVLRLTESILEADDFLCKNGILFEDILAEPNDDGLLLVDGLPPMSADEPDEAGWLRAVRDTLYGEGAQYCVRAQPGYVDTYECVLRRRQAVIEYETTRQAMAEYEDYISQLSKQGKVTDSLTDKSVWMSWCRLLANRLGKSRDLHPFLSTLSSEELSLVSVVTVRNVISMLCTPSSGRHPFAAPRGSDGVVQEAHDRATETLRHWNARAGKVEELPVRVYSCPVTNVCSQVGSQVNFELNRRRLENLHGKLRMRRLLEASNEAAAADGRPVLSQTRQLQRMMESKLGPDQDWDTIEKVRVGVVLVRTLMAEAFVHGDYHACKMELSEEARMDKTAMRHGSATEAESATAAFSADQSFNSITIVEEEQVDEDGQEDYDELSALTDLPTPPNGSNPTAGPVMPSGIVDVARNPSSAFGHLVGEGTTKPNQRYNIYKSKHAGGDHSKVLVRAFRHRLVRRQSKVQGELCLRKVAADALLRTGNDTMSSSNQREGSPAHLLATKLQPLVCKPNPWQGFWEGGYLTHRTPFIRFTGSRVTSRDIRHVDLTRVQRILDYLGSTPFKINERVLDVVEEVWRRDLRIGDIPPRIDLSIPSLPGECDGLTEKAMKSAKLAVMKAYKENEKLASVRPTFLLKLKSARAFRNISTGLYFPHNLDFRGRCYPLPPHLQHQGDDLCRGLLMFNEKKRLGERGWWWLRLHLANLFGHDKLKLQDRVDWTDTQTESILAAAEDPLGNAEFWLAADDPWQALAVIFEVAEALRYPEGPEEYATGISVHQDGSCNGLQHYAALGRDEWGAKAVNVLPNTEVQDVYMIVLNIVKEKVERHADQGHALARQAIELGVLKRKVVKQTVMTICYGVTSLGARDQVKKQLEDFVGDTLDADELMQMAKYLSQLVLTSIDEVFEQAMKIKKWFDVASRVLTAHGLPVCWSTPVLGMPCRQPYRAQASVDVSLQTSAVTGTNGTMQRYVKVNVESDDMPVSKTKQRMGFPPNFVHSLDGTHMLLTAEECAKHGLAFAAVHDSYWTHACDVDEMNVLIRDMFVRLHSEPILDNLYRDLSIMLGVNSFLLPELPGRGNLQLDRVKESAFFFD